MSHKTSPSPTTVNRSRMTPPRITPGADGPGEVRIIRSAGPAIPPIPRPAVLLIFSFSRSLPKPRPAPPPRRRCSPLERRRWGRSEWAPMAGGGTDHENRVLATRVDPGRGRGGLAISERHGGDED